MIVTIKQNWVRGQMDQAKCVRPFGPNHLDPNKWTQINQCVYEYGSDWSARSAIATRSSGVGVHEEDPFGWVHLSGYLLHTTSSVRVRTL